MASAGGYGRPLVMPGSPFSLPLPPPPVSLAVMRLIAFAFAYSCVLSAVPSVLGGRYLMTDNHVGEGFFHGFEHEAIPDPTNGRVCALTSAPTVFAAHIISRIPGTMWTRPRRSRRI